MTKTPWGSRDEVDAIKKTEYDKTLKFFKASSLAARKIFETLGQVRLGAILLFPGPDDSEICYQIPAMGLSKDLWLHVLRDIIQEGPEGKSATRVVILSEAWGLTLGENDKRSDYPDSLEFAEGRQELIIVTAEDAFNNYISGSMEITRDKKGKGTVGEMEILHPDAKSYGRMVRLFKPRVDLNEEEDIPVKEVVERQRAKRNPSKEGE